MARQPRSQVWTPAACYHVLNRGHARETIFHDDTDRLYFLDPERQPSSVAALPSATDQRRMCEQQAVLAW